MPNSMLAIAFDAHTAKPSPITSPVTAGRAPCPTINATTLAGREAQAFAIRAENIVVLSEAAAAPAAGNSAAGVVVAVQYHGAASRWQVKLDAVHGRDDLSRDDVVSWPGAIGDAPERFTFPEAGGWGVTLFGDLGREGRMGVTDPRAGERLNLARGHVGMVVGSGARAELWEPLAAWLSRVSPT